MSAVVPLGAQDLVEIDGGTGVALGALAILVTRGQIGVDAIQGIFDHFGRDWSKARRENQMRGKERDRNRKFHQNKARPQRKIMKNMTKEKKKKKKKKKNKKK